MLIYIIVKVHDIDALEVVHSVLTLKVATLAMG